VIASGSAAIGSLQNSGADSRQIYDIDLGLGDYSRENNFGVWSPNMINVSTDITSVLSGERTIVLAV
jgi:hypothetical protein